jgi:hypothetical protein
MIVLGKSATLTYSKAKETLLHIWRMIQGIFLQAFKIHPMEATKQILYSPDVYLRYFILGIAIMSVIELTAVVYYTLRLRVVRKRPLPPTLR